MISVSVVRRLLEGGRHPASLVAALAVAAVVLGLAPAPSPAQATPVRASFDWSTEARFGFDADGDGVIEIENTPEAVHNRVPNSCPGACPPFRVGVKLFAQPTPGAVGLPASGFLTYEWRVSGPAGSGIYHRVGPGLDLFLPEGDHDIDLRVRVRLPWGSVTLRSRGTMVVEDLLVVAIGDSYASGEGNPDVARGDDAARWADALDSEVAASHSLAHRSSVGWPARLAMALEDRSRRTSVTFIDLAASGARIDRGLLQARGEPAIPAQLDEVERIVQARDIDILLVQVGGNDVGFSRVIRALVESDPQLNPFCYGTKIDNVWASVADGVWDRGTSITYDPPFDLGCESVEGTGSVIPGLDGLGDAFDRLASRLQRLQIGQVLLVEYPDPTGGSPDGGQCDEIVGDVTAPFGFHEVDSREQAAAVARLLDPLNRVLQEAATSNGWTWVGGVATAYSQGHGYCAPWPNYGYPDEFEDSPLLFRQPLDFPEGWYRPPGRYQSSRLLNEGQVSWYRTAGQSAALQGPSPRLFTSGTLHPNELGHAAISLLALSALAAGD